MNRRNFLGLSLPLGLLSFLRPIPWTMPWTPKPPGPPFNPGLALEDLAKGDLVIWDAADSGWRRLKKPDVPRSGQFLQSQGASAEARWVDSPVYREWSCNEVGDV